MFRRRRRNPIFARPRKNVRALAVSFTPYRTREPSAKLLPPPNEVKQTKNLKSPNKKSDDPFFLEGVVHSTIPRGDSGIYTSCATIIVTRTHTHTHAPRRRRTRGGNAKKKTELFFPLLKIGQFHAEFRHFRRRNHLLNRSVMTRTRNIPRVRSEKGNRARA